MELPKISTGTYASSISSYTGALTGVGDSSLLVNAAGTAPFTQNLGASVRRPQAFPIDDPYRQYQKTASDNMFTILDKGATMAVVQPRRLVRIIIADPDPALPLDKVLLYNGEEKFTDATDQELFFEVDIQSLLNTHNAWRTTVVDPESKDKKDFLKKARVRDLRMTVLTITSF
jgi:hypothetical protein